ncbi:MAG TPA: type I secretion C-terminal target domain-containing protein, partial [Acetobacteraceae bacterium]|nr:type I secretion C-terminal target domain-containing protein [Acetobacteraceae bacterium]
PATLSAAAGQALAVSGVSLSDPWAANHPGSLALNVTASSGTVSMKDANGNPLGGSGSGAIHTSGSLAQITAELAGLSYTPGSNGGSVTIDVWDQAGAEATKSFAVTISGTGGTDPTGGTGGTTSTTGGTTGTTGGTTGGTGSTPSNLPTVTIAANDASPVESVSNTQITASSGDHMIFINGTGDVLNATGGTETVMAFQGGNQITTGAGNDLIRFAGNGNVVNAGAGQNVLQDSGSNGTIVLPGANQGFDNIYGWVLQNGDKLDLRQALAGTSWQQGDLASIGNYVKVAASGDGTSISIDPTGTPGGASYAIATLQASGPSTLSTVLAHSIT